MQTGAITGYIDVAQVALYAFWIFFACLIFYIRREDRREGYPLETDDGRLDNIGPVWIPDAKTFRLPHGGESHAPNAKRDSDRGDMKMRRLAKWPGSPHEPTGNPMLDGVGPGGYALRADVPDMTLEGAAKIVPMRVADDYSIAMGDADPRGMNVLGADGVSGGTISDVWVDRSEQIIRYLEVALPGKTPRSVLLPMTFALVEPRPRRIRVNAILGKQFAAVPATAKPDQVTLLEEDKICAYYGGGKLYATPERAEPLI